MSQWRQPSLDAQNRPRPKPQAEGLSLGQRVEQMPHVDNDQAFMHALHESNQLPIPSDLAISIHIPNEQSSGCAPQKWAAPLTEQIKRLASRIDEDRLVHELHIHIDQKRSLTTLIQHLIHQVEAAFSVAGDASLSVFAPIGTTIDHVLIEQTAFKNVHLDYVIEKPHDFEEPLASLAECPSIHTTIGITISGYLSDHLEDAPIDHWLPKLLEKTPDRLSFESFRSQPGGYQNLFYGRLDATLGLKQLKDLGYHAIGSGTFSGPNCLLARAQKIRHLTLGLDGYLTRPAVDQFGIGPAAMSWVGDYVSSNHTDYDLYARMLTKRHLPIAHGLQLHLKDVVNQAVLNALICDHAVSIDQIQKRFLVCFKRHFPQAYEALQQSIALGFLSWHGANLKVTDLGMAHLPSIVSPFTDPVGAMDPSLQSIVHIN